MSYICSAHDGEMKVTTDDKVVFSAKVVTKDGMNYFNATCHICNMQINEIIGPASKDDDGAEIFLELQPLITKFMSEHEICTERN